MRTSHRDQLSALDASFLAQEDETAHMHMGAVLTFAGPAPPYDALLEHVRGRLHLTPRYRQKLAFPPYGLGRPFWVDDPFFNLAYHVREAALPAPGSIDQLRTLAGRIFSERLDRSKPLWEAWLVHGLEDDGFAIVSKTHHCLVDGISGIDLVGALFDAEPGARPRSAPDAHWAAKPVPSEAELAVEGLKGMARIPIDLAGQALGALDHPERALGELRDAVEGVADIAWTALNPAPETPLNRPIGPHRRVHWTLASLDDVKLIKDTLGGTVNDVLMAVVTGALRRWLPSRGVRPEGLELFALVPVSVRQADDPSPTGNRLLVLRGALPVYAAGAAERLTLVREAMDRLKGSKQALGAEVIQRLQGLAPTGLLAQVSRINFTTRLFNLLVTNVPGPQAPLYLLGHELRGSFPVAFLAQGHALAVAIMSYNGGVHFGLLADDDALPDLPDFSAHLDESLGELLAAARATRPTLPPAPADANGRSAGRPAASEAAR